MEVPWSFIRSTMGIIANDIGFVVEADAGEDDDVTFHLAVTGEGDVVARRKAGGGSIEAETYASRVLAGGDIGAGSLGPIRLDRDDAVSPFPRDGDMDIGVVFSTLTAIVVVSS